MCYCSQIDTGGSIQHRPGCPDACSFVETDDDLRAEVARLTAEFAAERAELADADAALVAAEADLDERRKELAAERGKRRLFKERVREACNAACACGGSGPDTCCDACRVWHNLGGERMDTAEGTPHRNL